MKNAKNIIEHIIKRPSNKKILQKRCFERVKNALPPHFCNAIEFIYLKNQTLFFVLNHPGMKMEFNYKHNLIKNLLNKLKYIDENCSEIEVIDIKSFVSNKVFKKSEEKIERFFKEKSTGEFKIESQNEELIKVFKNIQKEISKINEIKR
jgi:hypothetical protein